MPFGYTMESVDLAQLRYFVGVAETLNFSRAAARLRISQPALSRQVRALETDLGVQLFNRFHRRVALTAEGQQILDRARDVLREADSLREQAEAIAGGRRGVLHIGATANTLETFVPGLVRHFGRRHRGITFELSQAGGEALLNRVERGDLHLAITRYQREPLRAQPLFPAFVLAAIPRTHPWSRRRGIDIHDIGGQRLLAPPRGSSTRELLEDACRAAHVRSVVVLECDSPHSLIALARTQFGIAIVSSMATVAWPDMRRIPIRQHGQPIGMWMSIVWDPRRFLPPHAGRFIANAVTYARRRYPGRSLHLAPPQSPNEAGSARPASAPA